MALSLRTRVELARAPGVRAQAWSREVDGPVQSYSIGDESRGRGWLDYVQGVTRTLREARYPIEGFALRVESDVPVGSGLSSSAALEVALLRGLRDLFALKIDDIALAQLAQRAENEFVGAPVGIMDPLVSSLGRVGTALQIDTRTLAVRAVDFPRALDLVVISSGIAHDHARGDYRTRRGECERAAAALSVESLSQLGEADLPRALSLPQPLGRRVRHVVTENARVLAAVRALEIGDLAALAALFAESQRSMRDDFAISTPEIDRLVGLAAADHAIVGARLTGGGFGGSIVALARAGCGEEAARRVTAAYGAGEILVPPCSTS